MRSFDCYVITFVGSISEKEQIVLEDSSPTFQIFCRNLKTKS